MSVSSQSPMVNCKLVVVGQGGVGKTTLLYTFSEDKTGRAAYVAPVFDNVVLNFRIDKTLISCNLWDSAGQDEYDRLRPLTYPGADIFLICFSVDSAWSFERVRSKWVSELQHYAPTAKYVLCALKTDRRDNSETLGHQPITTEQGQALAEEIGAMAYFEMSSVRDEGVKECFYGAMTLWLKSTRAPPPSTGGLFSSLFASLSRTRDTEKAPEAPLVPPGLPPREKPLALVLPEKTSAFATERASLVGLELFSDVDVFIDGRCIPAHRALLCAGSQLWRRLFGCATVPDTNVTHDDVNLRGALLPAIAAVATRRGDDGFTRTAVALGPQVSHIGAMAMLHFAYSGELPKLSLRDLQEARKQALLFDLAEMENWCVTVEIVRDLWLGSVDDSRWSEAENRKPALTTISARHRKDGAVLFNSATLADVAFVIESDGEIVYGHRALLHAHSPVMASQFGGRFADGRADDGALPMVRAHIGGVASETVLGLLDYVCCGDQAAIGERDVIDLMQLANRYDMAGLRKLCEKALIEELDRNVWERVLRADVDSIGLLVIAEEQRATQLTQYLTRFIGAHQHVIRKHQPESWTQLETTMPAHLEAIDEHKWPPQRYFDMLEAFELRDTAANASSSFSSWIRRMRS